MTVGAASPPEIRLVDLRKRFGQVDAVAGVNLDITTGEFFSLLGPSGCGKTTTLRMIGGFELPTGGRVELRGVDVTNEPPEKRPVNMVFQSYALFPHLSVADNIAFGLRRKGVPKPEIGQRVGEALELVHLEGFGGRRPGQMSGGQQQRVALARALVNKPQVLLLDEPLGALDLKLRRALQVELKRIQQEVGITFVYVTHDQEEALTLSDRIAVMHQGLVEQLGTPEELYERPTTRFVAGFIGTTNLMSGTVEGIDGGVATVLLSSGERCARERREPGEGCSGGAVGPPRIDPNRAEWRNTRNGWTVVAGHDRTISVSWQLRQLPDRDCRRSARLGIDTEIPGARGRGGCRHARLVDLRHACRGRGADRRRICDRGGDLTMRHPHDGSSIDLEKALSRYMIERRVSRRELLDKIAKVGAFAALGPIIAACTGGASASPSTGSSAAASALPSTEASPSPAAVPSPESELFVYNWTDYLDDDIAVKGFEEKYGVKVKVSYFDTIDTQLTKLGNDGGGYDVTFPTSTDIPDLVAKGTIVPLDKSLLPNAVNLGKEWVDPGYDKGNVHSVPYLWWTTGVGYDTTKVEGTPTSSKLLWDPKYDNHILMLDDWQEVFGMTLIQLGYSANTDNLAQLDEALALLEKQKPLVRNWSTDTIAEMSSGDYWVGQIWGSDLYQIADSNDKIAYFIPEEGGVVGSDTMVVLSGAQHPIAAHLFINHMLDAEVSAANTNAIGYMGPNAAAKEFIDPTILADPAVNPDQAVVEQLEELLDLPQALRDEYLNRWHILRGG